MTELTTTQAQAQQTGPAPVPIDPPKKRKRRFRKRWLLLGALALAAGFGGYGAFRSATAKPVVYYQRAEQADIDATLSVSGTVAPSETRSYFAPAAVKVESVNFKAGDAVKKGDVIATFDCSDLELALEKARLTLENAQLQYDDAMEDLDDSSQELYDLGREIRKLEAKETKYKLAYDYFDKYPVGDAELDGIIAAYGGAAGEGSDGMYDAWQEVVRELADKTAQRSALRAADLSENNQKVMDNNLELQRLQCREAEKLVNDAKKGIVADFDGIITELNLVRGSAVSPDANAVTVASTEGVLLRFAVGRFDVDRLALGQTAQVVFGGSRLEGVVTRIDGAATTQTTGDTTSTVLRGDITVEDPEGVLKLGIDADADILTAQVQNITAVPVEAVKTDKGGEYIYRVSPSSDPKAAEEGLFDLEKVYVETGIFDDSSIQIASGLEPGDLVCTVVPQGVEGGQVTALPTGNAAADGGEG